MSETIGEDVGMDELLEYPFRCFPELPTLQEMASYRFCQAVFRANIPIEVTPWSRTRYDRNLKKRVDTLVKDMNLPRPIEETLKRGTNKTFEELKGWGEYLDKMMEEIKDDEVSFFENDIEWCVWSPNGEIDYVKSATTALNSGRLYGVQWDAIVCKFCMEEEIKTLVLGYLNFSIERIRFNRSPLIFYWMCYLKNELRKIPLHEDDTSVEKTMAARCCREREVFGLEYFWTRLKNDDRISIAEFILRRENWPERWNFLERLFGTISSSGTKSLAVFSAMYLKMSLLYSHSLQHQLRIWHRFKHQIADRDFAGVITGVFQWIMVREDRMRILIIMWDTADDHHRQYVAQYNANAIINWFTGSNILIRTPHSSATESDSESESEDDPDEQPCTAAFYMLCRIISLVPESERSKLFKPHADELASRITSVDSLRKMLDLCFPSVDEKSEFKYNLSRSTKMQNTFVSLLEEGNRNDFNAKVELLFSNDGPKAVNEYKKLILTLMTWKCKSSIQTFFSSVRKWNELSQFVDETYAEDVNSAFEIKRMFVKRATPVAQYRRDFRQGFDVLRQIVEMVLPAQDLRHFKCVHLHCLGEQLQNGEYWRDEQDGDEIFLENFVEWCCDHDVESISKFKKGISHDGMLNSVVQIKINCCLGPRLNLESLLPRLDRYLKWLVGRDEQVRECKLQAIENSAIDRNMFKRASASQRGKQREIVLRWLCGGDEAVARRFKERRFGTSA